MIDAAPIQRFLVRVRQAQQAGARDIRLSIAEAGELTTNLAQLLMQHLALAQGIAQAQAHAQAQEQSGPGLDGGSL